MNPRRLLCCAVLLAALALVPLNAAAGTITAACSTSVGGHAITCAQYNGSAPLTAIALDIGISGGAVGFITNNAAYPGGTLTVTGSVAMTNLNLGGFAGGGLDVSGNRLIGPILIPDFIGAVVTVSGQETFVNTSMFVPYIGGGTFSFVDSYLPQLAGTFDPTGNISWQVSDFLPATLTASVSYTFAEPTAVPEPATLLLLGSGLATAAARRRFARR